jgi:hypothetical protein
VATARYFEGNHPGLEARLEEHFSRVRAGFETLGRGAALVLGGGYGRGEGGVMTDGDEPAFSNDLDYFLFTDAPEDAGLRDWCRGVERVESAELGIDVEIKCLRPDSIRDPSRSMMFADLVAAHVVVAGDAGFLETLRSGLDFSRIQPGEATRLLWNRGSGMFFARCRMGSADGLVFVIRNHAKLKLALGDAWLCLNGLYSPKCRERAERLNACTLPENARILADWHAEGVDFKFHPYSGGRSWGELEEEAVHLLGVWKTVYLATEERRLGRNIADFSEYLRLPRLLSDGSVVRNLALAGRDRLKRGGFIRPLGDYPRAGLMRALPCLLGLTPGGVAETARFLPRPPGDPTQPGSWEKTYQTWWSHYA